MEGIKKDQRSITLTHTYELLYKELEPGLAAYRLTNSATSGDKKVPKPFVGKVSTQVTEGLAATKSLEAFSKGRVEAITNLMGFVIVDEDFPEKARTLGYHDATKDMAYRQDYYTAFVEEGVSIERLIRFDYGNYLIYDRHDGVLPVARCFNYMQGHMHNGRYDLQKALEVLRTNPSVRFVLHERRDRGEPDSIFPIPYYNCDSNHTAHLSFFFSPTLEQERAIWEKQQSYGTQYPSTLWHRAVEDLDLLGLKAAGALYPEPVTFEEDDD
jgi:hypothetical protein